MPWCPVCKNEYVEGKTHCPDCDVDLVDELIEEAPEEPEHYIPTEEELRDLAARKAATAHMSTYTSAKNKYSEIKSSAWTFLLVGCAGFLIITLALLDIISLPLNQFALLIMEAMFIAFLIISALSFKSAAKLSGDISREDDRETRINAWAEENLTMEELTVDLDENTSDEMKYFMITELIRERLMLTFPEIDDAYAEELTERFYNERFS
ncbi:MAG: hypothetical protein KH452_00200 [Clostridiales bacterium]|nr:hypothetical protein [Clostridiales bacterium]